MLKIKPLIKSIYGDLHVVLFNDNKALVSALNNDVEPHPFASDSLDYLRQLKNDLRLSIKWVSTSDNLADVLTKPSRP